MDENTTLPLGLCKQASMKLDSFMRDVNEISEDEDLSPENKMVFKEIREMAGNMLAAICNIISKEMNEDEFIAEIIDMDEIEVYPSADIDLIDIDIK